MLRLTAPHRLPLLHDSIKLQFRFNRLRFSLPPLLYKRTFRRCEFCDSIALRIAGIRSGKKKNVYFLYKS